MSRLLLVRHGDTEFNSGRRFMGYSDIEMSPAGTQQIERLRDYLHDENIRAVYASDLKRTLATARILATGRNLDIIPCPELKELNYGLCEGMTFGEIGREYPVVAEQCTHFSVDLEFPDGENFRGFARRTLGFLKKLETVPPRDTVLVISHNGPLKVLVCHFLGLAMKHWWQLSIDVASLSIIETYPRGAVLTRLNDTSYLKNVLK